MCVALRRHLTGHCLVTHKQRARVKVSIRWWPSDSRGRINGGGGGGVGECDTVSILNALLCSSVIIPILFVFVVFSSSRATHDPLLQLNRQGLSLCVIEIK